MKDKDEKSYNAEIAKRLTIILEYSQLEILGLAKLLELSTDIVYSILSGRRKMSTNIAKAIGAKLNFDGGLIFNLNINIPESIKTSNNLGLFKNANRNNLNYFANTWNEQKLSYLIKTKLIENNFFTEPKYTWEVTDELKKYSKVINTDLINKQLKYFKEKKELKSKKQPLKLRNGDSGKRMVDVFWK